MKKKMTTVIFRGTQQQEAALAKIIDESKDVKGSLMTVLKRTIDKAPTMPRAVMRFVDTAMMTRQVIMFIAISEMQNDEEYITPLKVF